MDRAFFLRQMAGRPAAGPADAVKFLYQSLFGCGHLLPGEEACAAGIARELAGTLPDAKEPAFEPLGDGLCRLNLHNPAVRTLPAERIARMMRVTAGQVHGSAEQGRKDLETLRELAAREGADTPEGAFRRLPFTLEALDAYLQNLGDPMASQPRHSERYREAYRPAYRVVLRRYGEALPLLAALEACLRERGNATLALDGDCASGKTTLVAALAPLYDASVLHMDDFFLPYAMRTAERLAQPGGNVHYERFQAQVLQGLRTGAPFVYDAFDCHNGISSPVRFIPAPVTLIEGSYALHPAFDADYAALGALRVRMTVAPEEQERRIRLRNGEKMLERFQNEWIPLEMEYFRAYHRGRKDEIVLRSERHAEDEPPEGEVQR